MHGTQTTPISKRRIVGVVFTLAAGMLAVYFAVESVRYYRQLSKWQVAEPTHFPADLSRVGTFEGPFIQMCQISHGESIILKLPDLRDASPSLLEGLRGRLEIVG